MNLGKDIWLFLGGFVLLISFNHFMSNLSTRWDMTSSGIYTISDKNIEILQRPDDRIVATLMLSDKVPASFQKLKKETEFFLSTLHSVNSQLWYDVFDPNEGSPDQIKAIRQIFANNNVNPTNIRENTADGLKETFVYPYIHLESRRGERYINILEDKRPSETEEDAIFRSIQGLENKITKGVYELSKQSKSKIGMIAFDQLVNRSILDLSYALSGDYPVEMMYPHELFQNRDSISTAIIPITINTQLDKEQLLLLDQYIMSGGKLIWLVEEYNVHADSINKYKEYLPPSGSSTVHDFLFHSGVKLTSRWLSDWRSSRIPQVIGERGGRAQTEMFNYPFHPVMEGADHFIADGLSEINMKYPTTLEKVNTSADLDFIPLVSSSEYSKEIKYPYVFSFEILREEPDLESHKLSGLHTAALIEGRHKSYFANRLSTSQIDDFKSEHGEFKIESSGSTAQIVVSDLDFALPNVNAQGAFLPIGFNSWERRVFKDNETFLNNMIEYMMNGAQFLQPDTRSEYRLAALDKRKVAVDGTKWSYLNLIFAPILLTILHFLYSFYLKRKYA